MRSCYALDMKVLFTLNGARQSRCSSELNDSNRAFLMTEYEIISSNVADAPPPLRSLDAGVHEDSTKGSQVVTGSVALVAVANFYAPFMESSKDAELQPAE